MEGDAVKEMAIRFRGPENLCGLILRPHDWVAEDPVSLVKPGPVATVLVVATLGAVRDYVAANRDTLALDTLIAHVQSPSQVSLGGPLQERARNREWYMTAKAVDLTDGFLNTFVPAEQFLIGLQTRFAETDDRKALLRLLSTIKHEAVKTSQDDGVTQTVQARMGVVLVQDVAVPNPVTLTPYRTFREVTQPTSLFTLRVSSKADGAPQVGLFEADGGAWRLTATDRVRDWLVEHLPRTVAVIG